MTRRCILLLLLSLVALNANAFTGAFQTEEVKSTTAAANSYNAGKILIMTGAGIGLTGAAITLLPSSSATGNPWIPGGLYAIAAGGAVALIGVPFLLSGQYGLRRNGQSSLEYIPLDGRGIGYITEASVLAIRGEGFAVKALAGYHFSENIFLGGGFLGLGAFDMSIFIPAAVADLRLTLSDSKVSPYISIDAGYAFIHDAFIIMPGFGARLRSEGRSRNSWWFSGSVAVSKGGSIPFMTIGYSF